MSPAMEELRKVVEKRRQQCERIIAEANSGERKVATDTYAMALAQAAAYQTVLGDLSFCVSVYPDTVKREAA